MQCPLTQLLYSSTKVLIWESCCTVEPHAVQVVQIPVSHNYMQLIANVMHYFPLHSFFFFTPRGIRAPQLRNTGAFIHYYSIMLSHLTTSHTQQHAETSLTSVALPPRCGVGVGSVAPPDILPGRILHTLHIQWLEVSGPTSEGVGGICLLVFGHIQACFILNNGFCSSRER